MFKDLMIHWDKLRRLHDRAAPLDIAALFAADSDRAARFSSSFDGMLFDFSKTAIDTAILDALLTLAETAGLAEKRAAMFHGEKINETEGRAVLHTALRAPEGEPGAMRLLGLAAGVLLPTAAAQLLFVQIADALADQPQPALLEGSAPPEAAHREWRVLCLLVHLLGEPPSRLAGPEADALRWLLAGELDITGAGRQG